MDKEHQADELIRERWYIIKTSKSKIYNIWYFIVMAAALVNSIWTPLTISFDYAIKLSNDTSTTIYWIDYIANIIFLFDIVVHFFASYRDVQTGSEIFHPKAIAFHYLKGEFLFDFISSI